MLALKQSEKRNMSEFHHLDGNSNISDVRETCGDKNTHTHITAVKALRKMGFLHPLPTQPLTIGE